MFKILLLGLAPVAILVVVNQNKILKLYLQNALELTKKLDFEDGDKNNEKVVITIESDNKSEILKVAKDHLALIKSANNYIEVFWKSEGGMHKKLIRNTLTNIENQLKPFPDFIRCHRTALINMSFIERKVGSAHALQIKLKGIEESVPVSRQYALKVKEQLNAE